ncbi:galactose oxidase/kelch repeat superfamily protein [Striga asiatica]|uniref:Galactose oxidase/kelch repeat superfamily protein n=1 Tax=Striga asiatica TaxID=4170 RepID=A0A5A7RAD0_STRAF|nr:galactose oxidase/kelch repeat superfamily protein [Striga asiatica]
MRGENGKCLCTVEKENLSSDNKNPTCDKGYFSPVNRLDDVDNSDSISRARAGVCENRDKHVLFHVKRARVQREFPQTEQLKLPFREHGGHEPSDGESGHLYGDHGYGEWLRTVAEEGVEKGEEHAREKPQEPHAESPDG